MLDGMTNIKASEVLKELKDYTEDLPHYSPDEVSEALEMATKALEQQPSEDCISREAVLDGIDKYIKKAQSTGIKDDFISFEELVVKQLPPVTPRTNLAETSQDCISRQAVTDTSICEGISCNECSFNTCEDGQSGCLLKERVDKLPSVYPERINLDVIERIKKSIDEMTEIHSDGEFYIKNVDVKWIINKYAYGDGGDEDDIR